MVVGGGGTAGQQAYKGSLECCLLNAIALFETCVKVELGKGRHVLSFFFLVFEWHDNALSMSNLGAAENAHRCVHLHRVPGTPVA